MSSVLIGVCTARRPQMLQSCLTSLIQQNSVDGIAIEIVVIDNEATPANRETVLAIGEASKIPISYVHEPRQGIPFARNAILRAAINSKVSWVAMIDDDEIADKGWIAALMASHYQNTPVLMGRQILIYPNPRPFCLLSKKRTEIPEGKTLKVAFTHNVRFSTLLIEAGLRFDENLRLSGGEDSAFFAAASSAGFGIKFTNNAITYEAVHSKRVTYQAIVYRQYWVTAANMRVYAQKNNWGWAIAKAMPEIPIYFVIGFMYLVFSPILYIAGEDNFKRAALRGGRHIAKASGKLAALLGRIPNPYARIDGQ